MILIFFYYLVIFQKQQLVEECTHKNELQMQLASKESDIEQLRAKLLDLSDSTSIASFPSADETDGNLPGKNISITSFRLLKCHGN